MGMGPKREVGESRRERSQILVETRKRAKDKVGKGGREGDKRLVERPTQS